MVVHVDGSGSPGVDKSGLIVLRSCTSTSCFLYVNVMFLFFIYTFSLLMEKYTPTSYIQSVSKKLTPNMVLEKNLSYDDNDCVRYINLCLIFQKHLLLVSALGLLKRYILVPSASFRYKRKVKKRPWNTSNT